MMNVRKRQRRNKKQSLHACVVYGSGSGGGGDCGDDD